MLLQFLAKRKRLKQQRHLLAVQVVPQKADAIEFNYC